MTSINTFTVCNVTGLVSAAQCANTATGGIFWVFIMLLLLAMFIAVFYRSIKEAAIAIGLFLCLFPSMILVALHLMDPAYLLLNFIAFAASAILLKRSSS